MSDWVCTLKYCVDRDDHSNIGTPFSIRNDHQNDWINSCFNSDRNRTLARQHDDPNGRQNQNNHKCSSCYLCFIICLIGVRTSRHYNIPKTSLKLII